MFATLALQKDILLQVVQKMCNCSNRYLTNQCRQLKQNIH